MFSFLMQVASRELGIPMELIHIAETATSVTPNAAFTAGSTGCDVVAPAVVVKILKTFCQTEHSGPKYGNVLVKVYSKFFRK